MASPRRSWAVAAGILLLTTQLSGCGGHGGAAAGPTGSPTGSATSSPTSSPSGRRAASAPATPTTPAASASPSLAVHVVVVASTRPGAAFVSPSGNIACEIMGVADPAGTAQARCDIARHAYPTPTRPGSCPLDYGSSFELDRRATLLCAGDTVAEEAALPGRASDDVTSWFDRRRDPVVTTRAAGAPTLRRAGLPYGESLAYRDVTCTSARTGVTCRNTRTGAAFTVARAAYRLH